MNIRKMRKTDFDTCMNLIRMATKDMINKGFEQVKKFSWAKTAKQTLEVLQELGSKR